MAKKTVDEYVEGLEEWQADIVEGVRRVVLKAAPDTLEVVKWAQPVYESNGPFAYIKAFKNNVNFGFWRGIDIPDPDKILQGSGDKMRHVKLTRLNDIQEEVLEVFVKEAIKLNELKGDPTKNK
jgi:hypothetical protein